MNVQLTSSFYFSDSYGLILEEAGDAECGRAWKAMHRALSNGTLDPQAGSYPLNHVVLGGSAAANEHGGFTSEKSPQVVRDVAASLESLDYATFRERYASIEPDEHTPPGDCPYTWRRLQDVKQFYRETAEEGLGAVVITRVKPVDIGELERKLKPPPIDSDLLTEVISNLEGHKPNQSIWKWSAALREMGPAAKAAIPALSKALTDSDPEVRNAAKESLHIVSSRWRDFRGVFHHLGPTESLGDVISEDARTLRSLGVTHEQVASALEALFVKYSTVVGNVRVTGDGIGLCYPGCAFVCGCWDRMDHSQWLNTTKFELGNEVTGERIRVFGIMMHYIREHFFFAGRDSYLRVDPEELVRILELPRDPD